MVFFIDRTSLPIIALRAVNGSVGYGSETRNEPLFRWVRMAHTPFIVNTLFVSYCMYLFNI